MVASEDRCQTVLPFFGASNHQSFGKLSNQDSMRNLPGNTKPGVLRSTFTRDYKSVMGSYGSSPILSCGERQHFRSAGLYRGASYVHSAHFPCRRCSSCLQAGSADDDLVVKPILVYCVSVILNSLGSLCITPRIRFVLNLSQLLLAPASSYLVDGHLSHPCRSKLRLYRLIIRSDK